MGGWSHLKWSWCREPVDSVTWDCGHCGKAVAADQGWTCQYQEEFGPAQGLIVICPNCTRPTFLTQELDYEESWLLVSQLPDRCPGRALGAAVPAAVRALYEEAQRCGQAGLSTAAVMCCRKILMHAAVAQGAAKGQSFQRYVNWLVAHGWLPPSGKALAERVRGLGNAANHEIEAMTARDAELALQFTWSILHFMYEVPAAGGDVGIEKEEDGGDAAA